MYVYVRVYMHIIVYVRVFVPICVAKKRREVIKKKTANKKPTKLIRREATWFPSFF